MVFVNRRRPPANENAPTPDSHYTKPEMVRALLKHIDITNKTVLDAGSGRNKVWYNEAKPLASRVYECELEEGNDFFNWQTPVDWIVGNPPYKLGWRFTEHAATIAKEGIAFLLNHNSISSNTVPNRIDRLMEAGWFINNIIITQDRRWYGRYYFYVYTRQPCDFIRTEPTF